ncbi:hypothetical protein EVAR_4231_1 [Eumeta japonica]|uniref:Uncharacterized protein n=1 Tax=Eumeta variegata TaxID=151549 RepID=A0A4C1TH76_EUMVA|nr:hypothetical protein EVAR_4231_1 [Eumeta japonica]
MYAYAYAHTLLYSLIWRQSRDRRVPPRVRARRADTDFYWEVFGNVESFIAATVTRKSQADGKSIGYWVVSVQEAFKR